MCFPYAAKYRIIIREGIQINLTIYKDHCHPQCKVITTYRSYPGAYFITKGQWAKDSIMCVNISVNMGNIVKHKGGSFAIYCTKIYYTYLENTLIFLRLVSMIWFDFFGEGGDLPDLKKYHLKSILWLYDYFNEQKQITKRYTISFLG